MERSAALHPASSIKLVVGLALLAAASSGCTDSGYTGDGELTDRGPLRFIKRYELLLGAVELGRAHDYSFRMTGLPPRQFVLGFRLEPRDCSHKQSDTRIRVVITNERGEIVVSEEHALRDLTWQTKLGAECQYPFGYVRGRTEDIPTGGGNVCLRPFDHGRRRWPRHEARPATHSDLLQVRALSSELSWSSSPRVSGAEGGRGRGRPWCR